MTDNERLMRELLLRTLFRTLGGESLARMTELLVPRSLAEGELLFSAGDPSERFYFVIEGRVTMERAGSAPWVFGPRSVVGVLDAFREQPFTRTCRALADTRLLEFRAGDWLDLLEDDAVVARQSIRNIADRVHELSRADPPGARVPARPAVATPGPFSTYQKILIWREARFLASAGMQAIASLSALTSEHQLAASESAHDAGLPLDRLYLIVTGRVELASGRAFGPGELLGGPGVLADPTFASEARAVVPTVLLGLDQQDYYDLSEEHPRLSRGTLSFLAAELEASIELHPPKE
jgi:CRP-like cAMP-binding protein